MTTTKILVVVEHPDTISKQEVLEIVKQQVSVESDCYCDIEQEDDEGNEILVDNAVATLIS